MHSPDTQRSTFLALDVLALDTLIRLRWMAVLGQLGTVLGTWYWFNLAIFWIPVLLLISITALSNVLLSALRTMGWRLGAAAVPHVMVWDTLLFAGLLYWTGGTQNPFAWFLLLNAVVAALTLGRFSAWLLTFVGLCSLLLLTKHYHPLQTRSGFSLAPEVGSQGRIVAFFFISSTLIYLVQRLRDQLRTEMQQRKRAQEQIAEQFRFHAVATLAAGAAHEMGTPLSTIAVVSREMEIELKRDDPEDELTHMAQTIRSQVERCQQILSRLHPDQTKATAEEFTLTELQTLLLELSPQQDHSRLIFDWPSSLKVTLPRAELTEALGNLIRNALQASADHQVVEISTSIDVGMIRFKIRDYGPGIPADRLRYLGTPFMTSKPPGAGMGLGLHLVNLFANQWRGSLEAKPASGHGTEFVLSLPYPSNVAATNHRTPAP